MLKLSLLVSFFVLFISRNIQAGEGSLYDFLWLDPDKKVYVLQNKLYKKENNFYVDVGYLSNFTSKFQDTSGYAGRVGYYIREEWGVELFYNQYVNNENDDWKNLGSLHNIEPFVRRLKSSMGGMVIWSPFYGKINTFNQIYYFDWSFGLGATKIDAESNKETVYNSLTQKGQFEAESYMGLVWKTKVKFHYSEHIHLGIEWMQQHYAAPGPNKDANTKGKDTMRTNQDLILSVGFSF